MKIITSIIFILISLNLLSQVTIYSENYEYKIVIDSAYNSLWDYSSTRKFDTYYKVYHDVQ